VLDFLQVYVDQAHHGKEEEILFKVLLTKSLSEPHRVLIDELTAEHASGRKMFSDLGDVVSAAIKGNADSIKRIGELFDSLKNLYAEHIEKEDSRFFYPVMEYLSREEQNKMLQAMADYDTGVLHDRYEAVIADWEKVEG
jgi:hemerythrin-like domain-containing protein